jgi:hypothetical protein
MISTPHQIFGQSIKKRCCMYGIEERSKQDVGGETWGERQLGKPRHCWKNNIKMDLKEIGWGCKLDWSASGEEQVVRSCEHSDEPSDTINYREFLD